MGLTVELEVLRVERGHSGFVLGVVLRTRCVPGVQRFEIRPRFERDGGGS